MNMMNNDFELFEDISALADGQLQGAEFARTLALLELSADARATWHAYHLTGDVLRSGEALAGCDDVAFLERFQRRVQSEPTLMRNQRGQFQDEPQFMAEDSRIPWASPLNRMDRQSANSPGFRWKMIAGFASVVAVVAVSWGAMGSIGLQSDQVSQLAQTSAPAMPSESVDSVAPTAFLDPAVVDASGSVMLRDPHLDALVAAHRQFGGVSALQNPASFVQSATFGGVNR